MTNVLNVKYDNPITITVRSGDTGEVKDEFTGHNDVADVFLCPDIRLYTHDRRNGYPFLALLQDDPSGQTQWADFLTTYGVGYDPLKSTTAFSAAWRKDPWAPYSYHLGRQGDTTADYLYAGHTWSMQGTKHRLFYRWTKLPGLTFNLRAMALCSMDCDGGDNARDGITGDTPAVFRPQTLLVLPTAIPVKGRDNGNQTPDILEIAYHLSVVSVE